MIQRTGNSKIAVVGWGRGMGHKGHMYLASSVITQAQKMNADAYFFVSKTVGKDDPIFPEEKVKIYQTVFPQQAPIFQPQGNLNQALTDLATDGYQGVVLIVGADQKDAFKYLERPNKEGVPVYQSMGLQKLRVISRQETGDASAGLEGPRATPMREVLMHPEASEQQKFKVWRDAMPDALGDKEVMDLMKKAEARLMGSHTKKTKVAESRIMDRDARINAYYVSKKGDKHRVAENIPYYLLDKLVPLLTKKYAITMNDIVVKPVDQSQYRRTSQPELAEGMQANPNQVAELLYKVKPEIFSRFGDDFVMDAIAQACEQHTGSAQEVAVKVVDILKQGLAEGKKYKCTCHPGDSDPDCPVHGLEPMEVGDALDVKEGEEEALAYATQAHAGQTRSGGDPYITHPMRVADHIRKYKQSHNLDALISAAYLHDTIEDTDTTQEILHDLFGGLVASLVKELTSDPAQIKKMGKKHYLAHKMAAMSSYGLVIKLADRLDNVKDITTAKTPEWRHKYAQETAHILDYIEKTRALSGTHNKLIELIRAKLSEIDNPQQGVAEEAPGMKDGRPYSDPLRRHPGNESYMTPEYLIQKYKERLAQIASGPYKRPKEVAQLQSRIAKLEKQGVAEGFDREEFRRHMEQLRAREELRKTDPVSAKALDLRDKLPQQTKKKPEDDSMSINDPRHPGAAYTQGNQTNEGLMWDDTDSRLSIDDRMSMIESYYASKSETLAEANDQGMTEYFLSLTSMSDKPTKNGESLMLFLALVNNKVLQLAYPEQVTVLAKQGNEYTVKLKDGTTKQFPSKNIRDKLVAVTFFFNNSESFDKFRNIMSLKFDMDFLEYSEYVFEQLDEFAPDNSDDDDRTYEYEVYQCNPEDQFDWIGGPLYKSDDMGKVHGVAYELWKKHPDKAFMVWQERSQGSRGRYGPKNDEFNDDDDLTENNDYLDEK